jgi:ABC-2 type transport system ATP-binding protein
MTAEAGFTDATHHAGVTCHGLTKDFGKLRVLDDLSFTAPMGTVTGFVGVNGAGKSTTMRILLGLVAPTSGEALILGRRYADLEQPRHTVGAVLERLGAHPGQNARAYLKILAAAGGIPDRRVGEVLDLVGLTDDSHRRVGGYSLGMRQRLALGAALLGDPRVLILDEPANGLDPLGIRWIRTFVRDLADEGRCVLISSHQLSELEVIADRLVMIHKGRLIADTGVDRSLVHRDREVKLRTREPERLRELLSASGAIVAAGGERELAVRGLSAERIGEIAAANGIVLHSLVEGGSGLEEIFLELSGADRSTAPDGKSAAPTDRPESGKKPDMADGRSTVSEGSGRGNP